MKAEAAAAGINGIGVLHENLPETAYEFSRKATRTSPSGVPAKKSAEGADRTMARAISIRPRPVIRDISPVLALMPLLNVGGMADLDNFAIPVQYPAWTVGKSPSTGDVFGTLCPWQAPPIRNWP